ncbi:TIGR03560 family F420-dependent LLM class oxidoreductase [Jatrophihabitans sp.]|uniref:TIGR03560 family F420-dependent LLM class oxidoreductase n=1 Tax=Jatrophihabitans sp. TaxID=1932789 RepID=UPI0038CDA3D2
MIEPHNGASYDDQLAIALATGAAGLDGLFRADHYLAGVDHPRSEWLTDAWTTLAGLARDTTGITLGSLVSPVTFRTPAQLAILVAQVDAMSGGRIELGLGAGWWKAEHRTFGIDFPAAHERFGRMAEQLEIITRLWRTPPGARLDYVGTFYQLENAPGVRCHRDGGVPIIIGGSGPRRTPLLAARFAREFNSGWLSPARTRAEFDRVHAACRDIGRDPASLRLSTVQTVCVGRTAAELRTRATSLGLSLEELEADSIGITGTTDQAADRIRQYRDAGADRLYLEFLDLTDLDQLAVLAGEVLPLLT